MLKLFEKFYLKTKLSSGITALYSNIIIDQIGSGLVGIFMPIFLWQTFGNLNLVFLYYFLLWSLYGFLVHFGAKIMSTIGIKKAMILSVPFKVLFYFGFYYLSLGYPVLIFIALMVTVIEIRMILFWVPYHTDFAHFTDKKSRGKVIAFLSSISSLVSIFIPLISGWIIATHGYNVLFLIALLLVGVAIVPLFLVRPTYEKFIFSWCDTWRNFFGKKYRRMVLSRFADGMENAIGALIWPLFIFQLLDGDFLKVGALSSIIVLVTVVIRLIMGTYTDRFDKHKLMKWGSIFYSVGWFFKIFVGTAFQIFIASTYHNFAAIVMRTPLDALLYERAADSGHYVDEMTVIREMAITFGRAFCVLLLFVVISLFGFQWAFVLAAIASLFINLL